MSLIILGLVLLLIYLVLSAVISGKPLQIAGVVLILIFVIKALSGYVIL